MSLISVYCQFDPLEEVWLGDCYPAEFYQNFDPEIRSVFERITDITRTDLDNFEKILKSLGIVVRRPVFSQVENFLDTQGNLLKPPIAPRDNNMSLGTKFYHLRNYYSKDPWQEALEEYQKSGSQIISAGFYEPYGYLEPASIIRLGSDILIDRDSHSHSWMLVERDVIPDWNHNYNVVVCDTGGHADSVFCPVGTGRILTSHWKHDYTTEFPGWDVFHLPQNLPEEKSQNVRSVNQLKSAQEKNWWIEGVSGSYPAFNQYIENFAKDWIGSATETVFEVNSLMINENLILTTGTPDPETQQWFKKHQVEWIPIDVRARGFWDAGVHCLTVDIRRIGTNRKIINA
jgi:hypothetical protein